MLVAGGALHAAARSLVASLRSPDAGAAPPSSTATGSSTPAAVASSLPRGVSWSSFEYACAQGWGYSALDNVIAAGPLRHRGQDDREWGANTVRLPSAGLLARHRSIVNDQVRGAHCRRLPRRGAEVRHRAQRRGPGRDPRPAQPQADRAAGFGNLAMPDSESIAFWKSVAQEYAGNPSVMFERSSRPTPATTQAAHYLFGLTWACWRDGGCTGTHRGRPHRHAGPRVTYPVQGMAAVVTRSGVPGPGSPSCWAASAPRQRPEPLAGVRSRRRPAGRGRPTPTTSRRAPTRRAGTTCSARWPTASRSSPPSWAPSTGSGYVEATSAGPTSTASECCSG